MSPPALPLPAHVHPWPPPLVSGRQWVYHMFPLNRTSAQVPASRARPGAWNLSCPYLAAAPRTCTIQTADTLSRPSPPGAPLRHISQTAPPRKQIHLKPGKNASPGTRRYPIQGAGPHWSNWLPHTFPPRPARRCPSPSSRDRARRRQSAVRRPA